MLFKRPEAIIVILGSVIAILGTVLGWVTIGVDNALVQSVAEEEFQSRYTILIVVSIIVTALTFAALKFKKRFISILPILMGLYAMVMVFNQIPSSEETELLEVSVGVGLWLSLLGAMMLTGASIAIVARGFKSMASAPYVPPQGQPQNFPQQPMQQQMPQPQPMQQPMPQQQPMQPAPMQQPMPQQPQPAPMPPNAPNQPQAMPQPPQTPPAAPNPPDQIPPVQ